MKYVFFLMLVGGLAGAAGADVVTNGWINKSKAYPTIKTAANWEGGVAPAIRESARLSEVFAFTNSVDFYQEVFNDDFPSGNVPDYFGTLVGPAGRCLCAINSLGSRVQWLQDASEFQGSIGGGKSSGGGVWVLQSTPAKPSVVNNLRASCMASVGVGDANATGIVRRVYGEGQYGIPWDNSVTSVAAGTMEVEEFQTGSLGNTYVTKGRAIVHGKPAFVPAIVGDPYVHLDAQASGTMTISQSQGTNYVSRWEDVRGNGFALVQNGSKQLPFLSTDAASGLPVVDFGAYAGNLAAVKSLYGKPATMVFNDGGRSDIREVFIVFKEAWISYNCSEGNTLAQNLLCSAPNASQYYARTRRRRTSSNVWFGTLFANLAGSDDGGYSDLNPANGPVARGDIRVNGTRLDGAYFDSFDRSLYVVSAGTAEPTAADRLCENGNGKLGGLAYAEILIYTNALTSLERRQVNDYLRARWQSAEMAKDCDSGWTRLSSGATLEVADGTYVTRRLTANGSTFEKEGAGDLEVQDYSGASTINVKGGHLALRKPTLFALSDDKPAGSPEFWFDAAKGVTSFHSNDVDYVTKWTDCRPDGVNCYGATAWCSPCASYVCPPTVRTDFANGLPGIDFGPLRTYCGNGTGRAWTDGVVRDSSCMKVCYTDPSAATTVSSPWHAVRDVFMVFSTDAAGNVPFIGSTDFHNSGVLLGGGDSGGGNRAWTRGALWRCNGVPVDPRSTSVAAGQVYVISVRLPFEMYGEGQGTYLGFWPSGWGNGFMGNVIYGEVLFYPYVLTDEERRQTETYLLKKWKAETHPGAALATKKMALATVSFGADADPEFDSDYETNVQSMTSPSGRVVKKGAGDLTVNAMDIGVDTYEVQAGKLATSADWLADAALHVDASQEDTIVFREGQEADKRIDKWLDCRGNGWYAQSLLSYEDGSGKHPLTNGVYGTTADASSGLKAGSHYVDFITSEVTAERGGMYWYDDSGTKYSPSDVREYHVVFAMTGDGNYQPIGGPSAPAEDALVPAGGLGGAFWSNCTRACNAVKKQDGSDWYTANRYTYASGSLSTTKFYITSLQFAGNVKANSFALDRNASCGSGNIRLCEAIVFTGATNTSARCAAIHEYLRRKWKGESAEGMGDPLPVAMKSLTVAAGATLEIDSGDSALSTKALSGAGTVVAANGLIVDGANPTFDATFTDAATCLKLTVSGSLALPSAGTVVVTSPAGVRLARGFYPILAADSLAVDLAGWTVNAAGAFPHRSYRLVRRGNELGILVGSSGAILFVR